MIVTVGRFEIDDDRARVDRDAVWRFLSTEAYWGRTRSRADLEAQLDEAWRLVAAYDGDGATVGFARAVSDGVNFAYLADVYVEAVGARRRSRHGDRARDGRGRPGPRLPLDALHERRARPVRPLRLRGAGRDGDGAPRGTGVSRSREIALSGV